MRNQDHPFYHVDNNPDQFITYFFIFSEGRCLLELTHKSNQEGSEHWVPIAKKVYWPPPGPVKAESSPSVQSGKNFFI